MDLFVWLNLHQLFAHAEESIVLLILSGSRLDCNYACDTRLTYSKSELPLERHWESSRMLTELWQSRNRLAAIAAGPGQSTRNNASINDAAILL
jgi:hypothetical protein